MFSQMYEQPWKSEAWDCFQHHHIADDAGQGVPAKVGDEDLKDFE
jgi:hypothetical protein